MDDGDRLRYLHLLRGVLHASGCQLHAYVLMNNHVHLLATPPVAGRIGQLMQRLSRNYVAIFNGRHGRTGTLWEGRYKSCLVDSANFVLRCYRYIELNPVRARLIDDPAAYRWSSCAADLGQREHSALTPHPSWLALGSDAARRSSAYRALLDEVLSGQLLADIRIHLQQQRALGHDASRGMVARRFAGVRPAHRPRKSNTTIK